MHTEDSFTRKQFPKKFVQFRKLAMLEVVEIMLCVILSWTEHCVEGDLPYIAPGAVRSVMQWGGPGVR